MYKSKCKSFLTMAILGGLALAGPPVLGASVGIHGFQAHQVPVDQSTILPPLHEPPPSNVPTLTNAALIRLWEHNQFSPVLRDPGIQIQLSTAVSEARGVNPARFDRFHPVLGQLIRNPDYFNTVLNAYITHPARFVHNHHHLIPFLRGFALMREKSTTTPPAISPEEIVNPGGPTLINPVPDVPPIEQKPPNPPSDHPTPLPSVPAPPSIVLMVLGVSYVAARIRIRRPFRRPNHVHPSRLNDLTGGSPPI